MPAQTTFILKGLTEGMVESIANMPAHEAHEKLMRWALADLRHCVTVKNGNGCFRDRVEWNQVMRAVKAGEKALSFKIEPRRGYRLATFTA